MSGEKVNNLTIALCENTSPDLEKSVKNTMSLYHKHESKVRRTDIIKNGLTNRFFQFSKDNVDKATKHFQLIASSATVTPKLESTPSLKMIQV